MSSVEDVHEYLALPEERHRAAALLVDTLSPAVAAETERMALLLRCLPHRLDFLRRFGAAEIRALRLAVGERMYQDNRATYARIAAASRLLPTKVTAPLAQRVLPARVSAGVVASLPPEQASAMSQQMSVEYVTDVSMHLLPTLAQPVLTRFPVELIVQVAAVLQEREDFNTMGEIVAALSDEQILAVVEAIEDAETLVQVALRVTDDDALQRLALLLPEERLVAMITSARRRTRLWPELTELLSRLPAAERKHLLSAERTG